ncbi:hypothetical protein B0H13DRAFT_2401111 [Mycena leptocephala]|nr:hypothetical protein B0H13DRAFT_2401111 [Mycena leptocephala]
MPISFSGRPEPRVSRTLLSARSSVFRDMIAFPQPNGAQSEREPVDGHQIVRLYDRAGEMEVFLRAVFNSSFFMPPPSPADFQAVIGICGLRTNTTSHICFSAPSLTLIQAIHRNYTPSSLSSQALTLSIFGPKCRAEFKSIGNFRPLGH